MAKASRWSKRLLWTGEHNHVLSLSWSTQWFYISRSKVQCRSKSTYCSPHQQSHLPPLPWELVLLPHPPILEKRAGSNLSKDARHSWAQGSESSSTRLGRVLMHGCMTSYLADQEWTHSVALSPVYQKQSLLNKGRAGPQEYIPLLLPHEGHP